MSSPHGIRTTPPAWALIGRSLVVCALLLAAGAVGCGGGDGRGVGTLLDTTDEAGRHYRQVEQAGAPDVGLVVQPGSHDGWDLRLTLHNFRFSPAGTARRVVPGHGDARLYLDGRPLARLHGARYHIPGALLPRGTHEVTARLYADDRTVWAVDGKPVESTADLTASRATPATTPHASGPGTGPDPRA